MNRPIAGMTSEARVKTGLPRTFEVVMSLLGLFIFSPLLALSAMAITLSSRGPALFRQRRVGHGGRIFTLYKLRTMRPAQNATEPLVTARGDMRITRIGKILRRTKIDELPQLWNVIKGEMALVGPRPEVPRYVNPDSRLWRQVLQAKPGITDPVTLAFRNEEELMAGVTGDRNTFYVETLQPIKLQGYIEYLQQRSWQSDLKILCKTCLTIFISSKALPPR